MIDFAISITPELYSAVEVERAHETKGRSWLRLLRSMDRHAKAGEKPERTVIISKPAHLAGVHKL